MTENNMTETAMLREILQQKEKYTADLENKHWNECLQIAQYQNDAVEKKMKLKLIDLLKLIHEEQFPLIADRFGIDSAPQSVFTVTLAFQSEETWLKVNIANEILVPWYDCEVDAIQGSCDDNDIVVWLKDTEYIKQHWARHIDWGKGGERNA